MRTLDYTTFGEAVGKQAPRVLLVQSGLSVYHRICGPTPDLSHMGPQGTLPQGSG